MTNQVTIISNESIFENGNGFFCDNIDMKSIPEELSKNFEILLISKRSKKKRFHKINFAKIITASNIFSYLFNILKTFEKKEKKYLLISITPYTFFACLILFVFRKKIFIYLRSDGYEESRAILGFIGYYIYHIMFVFVTFRSQIITWQKRLTNKKSDLVFPSELDEKWIQNTTEPALNKPKLLYVGRMKIEKGIFSLFKIFNEISTKAELTILGQTNELNIDKKKIKLLNFESDASTLIKIYDDHNILILPSFTEAHPKVVDESLARKRPVIVFTELKNKIQNRHGVFVSERNAQSLSQTIDLIINDYANIQKNMEKNVLPTKKEFIEQMTRILN